MRLLKLFAALIALCALPFPARAQFQGFVGLQTVNATVANNLTCTGTPQNFTTAQNIPNFKNLGQTSHLATATSNASQFQMEIDGLDNLGNAFRLSDLQLGVPSSAKGGIVVTASGYMTNIQISVTCTALATFSVSYSGSFSPQPPNFAGALLNAVDKLPFQTAAANANSSTTFQTPGGNSAGTIIFQYSATGPGGSTITAQCLSNAGTNLATFSFSPTTVATPQLFSVASGPCPFVNLTYTSGGASAVTYNLEYVFVAQGNSQTTTAVSVTNFPGTQPVSGTVAVSTIPSVDPCLSPSILKSSSPINIVAAGTTQIVGLVGGQKIYPCSVAIDANVNSSAVESFQWEYGTGASCGTGTTTLTGAMLSGASTGTGPVFLNLAGGTLLNIPVSNALCLVVVQVSGTNVNVSGHISYVQQ